MEDGRNFKKADQPIEEKDPASRLTLKAWGIGHSVSIYALCSMPFAILYIKMPKVSVIIPTYNRLPMLKEAIDSVLAQDFEDFELIVVDDGSTDGTADEIKKYGGRVKLIQHSVNKGVSTSRNRGILQAKGKYIALLDSDDLWVKGKLKIQVAFLDENPQYPVCYTDEIWIRKGKRVNPMRKHVKYSGWIFEKCLPLCIISPSSAMIRKTLFSKVGLFDEALPVCEDYDFWLRVSARFPIFFINRKLIIKRGGHSDQLSQRSWGNDRYRVMALEKLLSEPYIGPEEREMVLKEMKRKCKILSRGFFKRGNDLEGRYYQEVMRIYGIEIRNTQIPNINHQIMTPSPQWGEGGGEGWDG